MTNTSNHRSLRHRIASHRIGGASGFSLIEVMIALIVFSIGVLGLAALIPLGTSRIGKAGNQTRASALAAQRSEDLLTTPYGDGDLTDGTHTDAGNPFSGRYYVKWVVEDDQPIVSTKRVTVSVSKNSVNGPVEATIVIVCPASGG